MFPKKSIVFLLVCLNLLVVSINGQSYEDLIVAGQPQGPQIIGWDDTAIERSLREVVILNCTGYASPNLDKIKWLKDNSEVSNDKHYHIGEKRILEGNIWWGILFIKDIRKEHYGIYTCIFENGYGTDSRNFTLTETEPKTPCINSIIPESSQIRESESDIEIKCIVQDLGENKVEWLKKSPTGELARVAFDGKRITKNTNLLNGTFTESVLKISDIEASDEAEYICQIRHAIHNSKKSVKLTVPADPIEVSEDVDKTPETEFPPQVSVLGASNIESYPGQNITFTCLMKVDPTTEIKWEKTDQKELDLKQSPFQSNVVYLGGGYLYSQLHFINISEEYFGEYACIAQKGKNEISKSFFTVQEIQIA